MEKALKFIDDSSCSQTEAYLRYGHKQRVVNTSIAKEAVRMALQSNCKCSPEETTGAIQKWVCNICGKIQEKPK